MAHIKAFPLSSCETTMGIEKGIALYVTSFKESTMSLDERPNEVSSTYCGQSEE